jgi:hypothetical protein
VLAERQVDFLFEIDGVTGFGAISGIIDVITREVICDINHIYDPEGAHVAITLVYRGMDGQNVTVTVTTGEPDYEAILLSATYADGVFYGMPGGGIIQKARNEYDQNGRRVFSILKTWSFDENGARTGLEVSKERLYYDNNGNLVYKIKTTEADGRLREVASTSYAYNPDGSVYMSVINRISYNADGTINGSFNETALYDTAGRQIRYRCIEERNNTEWNVRGWEKIETQRDAQYDSNGKLVYKREFRREQTIPRWGPYQGQLVTAYEGETVNRYEYDSDGNLISDHETGYWFTTYIDPYFDRLTTYAYGLINGIKQLVGIHIAKVEATDSGFANVTYRYNMDTSYKYSVVTGGLLNVTTRSVEESINASWWTDYIRKEQVDSADYDENGKLIRTHHFYKHEYKHGDQVTWMREEDTTVDYSYDADGDLVDRHEYGYWLETRIDPFFDRLTNFVYGFIDDVKKVLNIHETFTEAYDAQFADKFHFYEKDETYTYTTVNCNVLLASLIRVETDKRLQGGSVIGTTVTRTQENYGYDAAGNLVTKATTIYTDGSLSSMELLTYAYYSDRKLASTTRYTERYGQWETETKLYNTEGNLMYSSFTASDGRSRTETRQYGLDGKTLLSVDIIEHNPPMGYWGWDIEVKGGDSFSSFRPDDYELHERYNSDGKIISRTETTVRKSAGGPWCIIDPPYIPFGEEIGILHTQDKNIVASDSVNMESVIWMPYYPWWNPTTTTTASVETWSYSDNKKLAHYEKSVTITTETQFRGWRYYDWGWGCVPETVISVCTIKASQDYDPVTGELLKEEYSVSGNTELAWEAVLGTMKGRDVNLPVGQQGDALMDNIGQFFFDTMNAAGAAERRMIINYSADGKITISCIATDGNGQTVTAFFCTINYDTAGNILSITVSYTGALQDEWKRLIGSIDLTKVPVVHEPIDDPNPNDPPGDQEVIKRMNLINAAKKQSGGVFQRKTLMEEPQGSGLTLRWKKK